MQIKPFHSNQLMLVMTSVLLAWYFYIGQGHIAYTMDSLTYRDAAINFLNGQGFVTTNTFDTTPAYLPLLQWPPGFPALWASLGATGIPIDVAPQILCPALYACTLCLLYAIGSRLANNMLAGAASVIIFSAYPSGLAIFNFAWSETLFIPLVLAAFYALLRAHTAEQRATTAWLSFAVIAIGLANWTRYTGAIFLPLLWVSVFLIVPGSFYRRLRVGLLTCVASLLLVAPLWIRNFLATGNISGAARGGPIRYSMFDRLSNDLETLWNLCIYPLFHFDTLFYGLFGWPLLLFALYVTWRNRQQLLQMQKEIMLALLWATVILAFHLYARIVQQGIDFDYRMLAILAPFAITGVTALLLQQPRKRPNTLLLIVLVAMTSITLFTEGQRIRHAMDQNISPEWKSLAFAIVYIDLHKESSASKKLQLDAVPNDATILTDYRGLWIRYLTNRPAFQVTSADQCWRLRRQLNAPLVFVTQPPALSTPAGLIDTPAAICAKTALQKTAD